MGTTHRLTVCPVCGDGVVAEAGTPRLYRACDMEPHYCDLGMIRARLLAVQRSTLVERTPFVESVQDVHPEPEPEPVKGLGLGGFEI